MDIATDSTHGQVQRRHDPVTVGVGIMTAIAVVAAAGLALGEEAGKQGAAWQTRHKDIGPEGRTA